MKKNQYSASGKFRQLVGPVLRELPPEHPSTLLFKIQIGDRRRRNPIPSGHRLQRLVGRRNQAVGFCVHQKTPRVDERAWFGQSCRVAQKPAIFKQNEGSLLRWRQLQFDQQALNGSFPQIWRRLIAGIELSQRGQAFPHLRGKNGDGRAVLIVKIKQAGSLDGAAGKQAAINRFLLDHISDAKAKFGEEVQQISRCKRKKWPRVNDDELRHSRTDWLTFRWDVDFSATGSSKQLAKAADAASASLRESRSESGARGKPASRNF